MTLFFNKVFGIITKSSAAQVPNANKIKYQSEKILKYFD